MELFGRVGETLSAKGRLAAAKAQDAAKFAGLSAQAARLEGKKKGYYQRIGEKVYQEEKGQVPRGLEEEFDRINEIVVELDRIQKQLDRLKGVGSCPACGAKFEWPRERCPACGEPLEDVGADASKDVVEADAAADAIRRDNTAEN